MTDKGAYVGQEEFKIAMELVRNWVLETLQHAEAHILLSSSKVDLARRIAAELLKAKM